MVDRLINRFFTFKTSFQVVNMLLLHTIGPQPFLKIHRIHIYNMFVPHRN